ncbi:MAG: hypothetical protein AB8F95_12710 [Bacteroidia bacterium]
MKPSILFLFSCLLSGVFAQNAPDTMAVYETDYRLKETAVSFWIPTHFGYINLTQAIKTNFKVRLTSSDFKLIKSWELDSTGDILADNYLGYELNGTTLSVSFKNTERRKLTLLNIILDSEDHTTHTLNIKDDYYETDLYIPRSDERPGYIQYYSKGSTKQLRYYQPQSNGTLKVYIKPVEDKYLAKQLYKMEQTDCLLAENGFADNLYWNAHHDLKASWDNGVLYVGLPNNTQHFTLVYRVPFLTDAPITKTTYKNFGTQAAQHRTTITLADGRLYQTGFNPQAFTIQVKAHDLEQNVQILDTTFSIADSNMLPSDALFHLDNKETEALSEIRDLQQFFKKLKRNKHMMLGVAPLEDGTIQLVVGAAVDEDKTNLLKSIGLSLVGSIIAEATNFGTIGYDDWVKNQKSITWAELNFDLSTNTLGPKRSASFLTRSARIFIGYVDTFIFDGEFAYRVDYDRRSRSYYVIRVR